MHKQVIASAFAILIAGFVANVHCEALGDDLSGYYKLSGENPPLTKLEIARYSGDEKSTQYGYEDRKRVYSVSFKGERGSKKTWLHSYTDEEKAQMRPQGVSCFGGPITYGALNICKVAVGANLNSGTGGEAWISHTGYVFLVSTMGSAVDLQPITKAEFDRDN